MYIRRKVFSVGIDEYGEEKLFSVNEVISEEEYCQRIFAEAEDEEEKKRKSRRVRIAKGAAKGAAATAGVAGVGAAGVYGANKFAGKAADFLKNRGMNKLNIEKGLAALQRGGASATKWVKANPKLAAGIAAGTIATGAAVGAGTAALTGRKKTEE